MIDPNERDITCWSLKETDGKWYVVQEPSGRRNGTDPIAADAIWHEFATEREAYAYLVTRMPPTNSRYD